MLCALSAVRPEEHSSAVIQSTTPVKTSANARGRPSDSPTESNRRQTDLAAIDDFAALLEGTDVMKQVLKTLREEPAHLLGQICQEHQATAQPVPDHHLTFYGYLGEAALKALIAAGLLTRQPGRRMSLYSYQPTQEGLQQYRRLEADGFYSKAQSGLSGAGRQPETDSKAEGGTGCSACSP